MNPIDTAPRDGSLVMLSCESRPDVGEHCMAWNLDTNRWEGISFAVMRSVPTYWDESEVPVTHWRPLK
jgi:hypothetical protein